MNTFTQVFATNLGLLIIAIVGGFLVLGAVVAPFYFMDEYPIATGVAVFVLVLIMIGAATYCKVHNGQVEPEPCKEVCEICGHEVKTSSDISICEGCEKKILKKAIQEEIDKKD